jgi:polyisoprenoid-binding protein YceI
MKNMFLKMAALLLSGAVLAFSPVQNWQIADGYGIKFSSADAGGIFKTMSGTIFFDEQNLAASKFEVAVDAASLNTGNGLQNKHAKSDEWFDVARYPQITYSSDKITRSGNGFLVTGTLDLHGVKKPVSIPFSFQRNGNKGLFAGSFTVNRNDFHLGKPGEDVGEQIKIDLSIPVAKK